MLSCYIDSPEFLRYYDVERFATAAKIEQALRASTYELEETLRARGFDPASLQPPRMFDGLGQYETKTITGSHTTASLETVGSSRLVVESTGDGGATFALQGSPDGVTWLPVKAVDGNDCYIRIDERGTLSSLFLTRFAYYRLVILADTSITYRAFLVDAGPDKAIRSRAMYLLFLPFADKDTTLSEIASNAMEEYRQAMDSQVFSMAVDTDGDGDTDIVDVYKTVRLSR